MAATLTTFKHGLTGYTHHRCRCDVCRAANSAYASNLRRSNSEKLTEQAFDHGLSGYTNHCCRCDVCRAANSAYNRDHHLAYKEKIAKRRMAASGVDPATINHGLTGYRNYSCRCDVCRDAVNAYRRDYHHANKEKVKTNYHARRSRVAGNGVFKIMPGEWGRVLSRYRNACAYCGTGAEPMTMDHVVPVARGGRHAIGNIVPACGRCNSSKGAQLLIEWKSRTVVSAGSDVA